MNQAFNIGRKAFPWWPDWQGECVAIVASGPSVNKDKIAKLRDRIHVIAIKENIDLCPWADVVYGCDDAWWLHRNGLPAYKGLKLTHGVRASSEFKMPRVIIENTSLDAILVENPLHIGSGGNSGFQAVNLAVQFGATDLLLIGFDMGADPNHIHWYVRNKWLNANNPMQSNYNRWIRGFDLARKDLDRLEINVVNASPISKLKCFKMAGLDETMKEWGL